MKRFSAPPGGVYADPSRPPDDDDSDASSVSDGSKKVKTAQSFESLFNSEALSDIVLDVNEGQVVFHAHKMIIGLKSERLAALITSSAVPPADKNGGDKPVLHLQEPSDCGVVFSRFLYFIYSGGVWLHRDYVVPLLRLSAKYGVHALSTHCENYIRQILHGMLGPDPAADTTLTPNPPPRSTTQAFPLAAVCDLCEEEGAVVICRQDTRNAAFRVLCHRFVDLVRTDRWIACGWQTVRDLLRCDECACEENLILVSATDWMKRNRLQDKARIQDILSSIRYPRLPRRVLYHLHATASFKKFPPVQDLIQAAIRFHCFRDVPEAQADFSGLQYRDRGRGLPHLTHPLHTTVDGGDDNGSSDDIMCTADVGDNNNATTTSPPIRLPQCPGHNPVASSMPGGTHASCQPPIHDTCGCCRKQEHTQHTHENLLNSRMISSQIASSHSAPTLPVRERSRSQERHASPHREIRLPGSRHCRHQASAAIFDWGSTSSFHSPAVAAVPPTPHVTGTLRADVDRLQEDATTAINNNINNNNNNNILNNNNNNNNMYLQHQQTNNVITTHQHSHQA